jgi:hypothetical protein
MGGANKPTNNNNKSTNSNNKPPKSGAAAGNSSRRSSSWLWLVLSVAVLLAGVLYQNGYFSSPLPSNDKPPVVKPPAEPESSVTSETIRVGSPSSAGAEDDSVEHVHINLKANARADEGGLELDVAAADESAKAGADVAAYVAHVEAQWTDFVDDSVPEPKIQLSDDAPTRRLESIALLLLDHAALAEFMAFPYTPDHLRSSPSLKALDVAKRSAAFRRITDHWRQRSSNYHGLQRAATAFRDQLWSLVGDFEDATKLAPEAFLQLSRMERQIAAKEVPDSHELFRQVRYSTKSHLFWEFLDDTMASKDIL